MPVAEKITDCRMVISFNEEKFFNKLVGFEN
jgi:hypothetical protein